MSTFTFAPQKTFAPHPPGKAILKITEVNDEGEHTQQFPGQEEKTVQKLSVRLESLSHKNEDGQPFDMLKWMTVSNHQRAALTAFRSAVADRPLTDEELLTFDPAKELIGKVIECRVEHYEGQDGSTRAKIRDGSVAPYEGEPPVAKTEEEDSLPF